ncbi:MAG TPA: hypothetical protein VEL03_13335 [Streptosporangiaceae bacterium]|nr:hypothetical protein [Streptosporangiaceae bacterium]
MAEELRAGDAAQGAGTGGERGEGAAPARDHDEFRLLDDPVRGVAGSLDEMVHGVGGIFDGLDDSGPQ